LIEVDILKELKDIQKKADEGDRWKERYIELSNQIEIALESLRRVASLNNPSVGTGSHIGYMKGVTQKVIDGLIIPCDGSFTRKELVQFCKDHGLNYSSVFTQLHKMVNKGWLKKIKNSSGETTYIRNEFNKGEFKGGNLHDIQKKIAIGDPFSVSPGVKPISEDDGQ